MMSDFLQGGFFPFLTELPAGNLQEDDPSIGLNVVLCVDKGAILPVRSRIDGKITM